MQCEEFFDQLWRDYIRVTPQAERIHQLFIDRGEVIVNDHVALRTFDLAPINIASLEPLLLQLGYARFQPYQFNDKYLDAWSYLHRDETQPRIFFSELKIAFLSPKAQSLIQAMVAQVPVAVTRSHDIFFAGRPWPMPSWADYECLLAESEYAAWLSVMGLRANHFTISVNHLDVPSMAVVIDLLQHQGFELNREQGVIKGSPQTLLEQASTLADSITLPFRDGDSHPVKTCYYEFARRYPDETGFLYQGFVPANANAIFHSTDRG